jgi:hypothetical protein
MLILILDIHNLSLNYPWVTTLLIKTLMLVQQISANVSSSGIYDHI